MKQESGNNLGFSGQEKKLRNSYHQKAKAKKKPSKLNLKMKTKFLSVLLERGEGRKKKRERNIAVQEIHPSFASHTP